MAYASNQSVLQEAGLWESDNYENSPIPDADVTGVIEEADEWIDLELADVATVPFSPVPATVRKISRTYAAGLLMAREFGLKSITEETTKEGERKIAQAEKWLAEYRARLAGNSATTNGYNIPRATEDKRLFQTYDPSTSRWEAPSSETITVQRER